MLRPTTDATGSDVGVTTPASGDVEGKAATEDIDPEVIGFANTFESKHDAQLGTRQAMRWH
jgi:hypothetical protein